MLKQYKKNLICMSLFMAMVAVGCSSDKQTFEGRLKYEHSACYASKGTFHADLTNGDSICECCLETADGGKICKPGSEIDCYQSWVCDAPNYTCKECNEGDVKCENDKTYSCLHGIWKEENTNNLCTALKEQELCIFGDCVVGKEDVKKAQVEDETPGAEQPEEYECRITCENGFLKCYNGAVIAKCYAGCDENENRCQVKKFNNGEQNKEPIDNTCDPKESPTRCIENSGEFKQQICRGGFWEYFKDCTNDYDNYNNKCSLDAKSCGCWGEPSSCDTDTKILKYCNDLGRWEEKECTMGCNGNRDGCIKCIDGNCNKDGQICIDGNWQLCGTGKTCDSNTNQCESAAESTECDSINYDSYNCIEKDDAITLCLGNNKLLLDVQNKPTKIMCDGTLEKYHLDTLPEQLDYLQEQPYSHCYNYYDKTEKEAGILIKQSAAQVGYDIEYCELGCDNSTGLCNSDNTIPSECNEKSYYKCKDNTTPQKCEEGDICYSEDNIHLFNIKLSDNANHRFTINCNMSTANSFTQMLIGKEEQNISDDVIEYYNVIDNLSKMAYNKKCSDSDSDINIILSSIKTDSTTCNNYADGVYDLGIEDVVFSKPPKSIYFNSYGIKFRIKPKFDEDHDICSITLTTEY